MDRETIRFDPPLKIIEIVFGIYLEGESVDTNSWVVADRYRMVIFLIPAFEEDSVGGALADVEPHHFGVVSGGQIEIGDLDVHVAQSQDAHWCTVSKNLWGRGQCPAIRDTDDKFLNARRPLEMHARPQPRPFCSIYRDVNPRIVARALR